MGNNIKVVILYRDGKEETYYVAGYSIVNKCLSLYERYKGTRYIPLDILKNWNVHE